MRKPLLMLAPETRAAPAEAAPVAREQTASERLERTCVANSHIARVSNAGSGGPARYCRESTGQSSLLDAQATRQAKPSRIGTFFATGRPSSRERGG